MTDSIATQLKQASNGLLLRSRIRRPLWGHSLARTRRANPSKVAATDESSTRCSLRNACGWRILCSRHPRRGLVRPGGTGNSEAVPEQGQRVEAELILVAGLPSGQHQHRCLHYRCLHCRNDPQGWLDGVINETGRDLIPENIIKKTIKAFYPNKKRPYF